MVLANGPELPTSAGTDARMPAAASRIAIPMGFTLPVKTSRWSPNSSTLAQAPNHPQDDSGHGGWMRRSELRGHPVVLDCWATWCAPCKSSMPHLSAIQSRYRDRGLVVLGLSMDDEDPQLVRRFADRLGIPFRVAVADDHIID